LRIGLSAMGIAIGVLSILPPRRLVEERTHLSGLLDETGLDERAPDVADELLRETDPVRADLLVARALLGDVLDQLQLAPAPLDRAMTDELASRLAAARSLAEGGRRLRPAAWQAHMIVGATTYLEWMLHRDRRVATEAEAWEGPLRTAIDLAPAQAEPKRFLTMAYLELWTQLSTEKRELARSMVALAFEDPRMLQRLLGPWLELQPDVDAALAVVPDESSAWQVVERHYVQQRRWERVVEAHRRRLEALRRECEARLAEAASPSDRSSPRRLRALLVPIVTTIPIEASWSDLLDRTLERLPPGLPGKPASDRLRLWLEWNLDGCTLGRCRLPERSAARLAVLAGDLDLPARARSALAAGDLASAESFERQADRVGGEAWTPYLLEKVPHLLRRAETKAAVAALDAVPSKERSSLAFLQAARSVAEAASDGAAQREIARAIAQRAKVEWGRDDWQAPAAPGSGGTYRLLLEIAEPASGLELVADSAPMGGAVSEIRLDGAALVVTPIGESGQRLDVRAAVEPGLHLLELAAVAGGIVAPGPVRLFVSPR